MPTEYDPLFTTIAAILYQTDSDRDFFLAPSGLKGRWSLGEAGLPGYHLPDATPQEIAQFVRSECGLRGKR